MHILVKIKHFIKINNFVKNTLGNVAVCFATDKGNDGTTTYSVFQMFPLQFPQYFGSAACSKQMQKLERMTNAANFIVNTFDFDKFSNDNWFALVHETLFIERWYRYLWELAISLFTMRLEVESIITDIY